MKEENVKSYESFVQYFKINLVKTRGRYMCSQKYLSLTNKITKILWFRLIQCTYWSSSLCHYISLSKTSLCTFPGKQIIFFFKVPSIYFIGIKHSITKTEQKTNLLLRSNKTFEVIHFSKSLKSTRNYVHKLLFPKQTNEHKKSHKRRILYSQSYIFERIIAKS